ncbi:APC family permease [Pseudomonas typographi]|uniref:APC family permease n=1 Tax=Pseudomonas typographi TaxID=2715964 RepID=A0ABR7Z344_9PSED|nr:APC family permease [Pseudomonas typographi]MBD1554098.1 APC family permease [Pseudomonas typographi]MBD1588547.1 APC family permease [Pseudomonas typographi]MBD1599834.1 APC family permease [Pseudomonas typographi]
MSHPADSSLKRDTLDTKDLVLLVLAAVAPMGIVVSLTTLSIALGTGAGTPGTYIVAALIFSVFAVGYLKMSQRITNAGAFYAYISAGFGERAGRIAAWLAVMTYNAITIGTFGSLSFFSSLVLKDLTGIDIGWQWFGVLWLAATLILGYLDVGASAKVLAIALLLEVISLFAFDLAVLWDKGFHGFSLEVFNPSLVLGSGAGLSLILGLGSFIGFEATVIYGEEARDARRTVSRATYIAIALIAVFYLTTTWAMVSAAGVEQAKATAAADPASFLFIINTQYVGTLATQVMQVLVITSLFAGFLALHMSAARYHFSLARSGILPAWMGKTHPKYHSPFNGTVVQLALVAGVTVAFVAAGQHPYLQMGVALFGMGVLGIVLLQCLTSFAVFRYFRREPFGEPLWSTAIAPLLGGVSMLVAFLMMIDNYAVMTGSDQWWINHLPLVFLLAPVLGLAGSMAAGKAQVAQS